ncbi:MAG: di-trans,poly-cis-decaprenylcistransferase [Candidatus Aenigmarchaeota archaeon]|nr:di-trans,poly-cis-decaprenylcistransferase [Candidatus Aenigmarchaeota archaeon]
MATGEMLNNGLKIPNHIAIIPDGNRRWSKQHDMPPWKGHWKGGEVVDNLFDWCVEMGIPNVSIWAGSTENLTVRSKKEVTELFKVYQHFLEKWVKKESILDRYQVKVRFVGDIETLPNDLVKLMGKIMVKTAKYQKRMFNVLINYGGKFELLNVMKKLAEAFVKAGKIEITEKAVEKKLMIPVPVDLVVRTGGFTRLSNFMLWQSSYAELIVLNKLWPDFTKKDFMNCIKEFTRRQRNFGK